VTENYPRKIQSTELDYERQERAGSLLSSDNQLSRGVFLYHALRDRLNLFGREWARDLPPNLLMIHPE